MITFDEAFEEVEVGGEITVLLGNGFSQAWNPEIFNYRNLLEQANFETNDEIVRNIFRHYDTFDFESVMQRMLSTADILEIYGGDQLLVEQIRQDAVSLKDALIRAIAETHPDVPGQITDNQYIPVRLFLNRFDKIFTLNYDLLMYWARNQWGLEPPDFDTDDGFRTNQEWQWHDTDQEVFFLHGAMHLYDTSTKIKKHRYTALGATIIEQVRGNLENNRFPLFVAEPNQLKKKTKIEHNPYLNYCYEALRNSRGTMFIFGHSFDESDKHIFDQIKRSNTAQLYVSVYGDRNSESNQRTQANAISFLQRPEVTITFFDAETAPLWNEE